MFRLRGAAKGGCGILVYHDPGPEVMDRHLSYLKRHYRLISLDDLGSWLATGVAEFSLPALVLTMDDGHSGNHSLLDVFLKHRVRPTIYVCSAIVGTQRMFWWQHPKVKSIGVEALKRLPTQARLARLAEVGFQPTAEWPLRSALSVRELRELQAVADIQSHTRFHPILTRCNEEDCRREITQSKLEIEALLGSKCEHFAFPNGNYDKRTIQMVKEAGYLSARTCDVGWNVQGADQFSLKSFLIADDASLSWLDAQLTSIPSRLRYALRGGFTGRFPQF